MARVLLVEDNTEIRELYASLIERNGHVVTTANGVSSARELIGAQGTFDVLIVDFWLVDGNAIDVIKTSHELIGNIPVIMITGGGGDLSIEITTALSSMSGATKFLYKPVGAKELICVLNQVLAA